MIVAQWLIFGSITLGICHAAVGQAIDHENVSYTYPAGNQQPRGDLNPTYADSSGDQLTDGLVPASVFFSGEWVGFNEGGLDNSMPAVEFITRLGPTVSSVIVTAGGSTMFNLPVIPL